MMFGQCPWCGGNVGYGTSFWNVGLTLLFGLLILAGVILLIIWVVRSSGGGSANQPQSANVALEVAQHRYASGEITKEQYDEIRVNLG